MQNKYFMNDKVYVQFGAGTESIPGFLSFDSSPTLYIQRLPIIGSLLKNKLNCIFDDEILFGDIVKGLPLPKNSVDVVFSSHVLEHLALVDFFKAIENVKKILKTGGVFRLIVPNFRFEVETYLKDYEQISSGGDASIKFTKRNCIGKIKRSKNFIDICSEYFGNSAHLWLWDDKSLYKVLNDNGFGCVESFQMGEPYKNYSLINLPERSHQFEGAVAFQCIKK
jgi:predicted SAM-dependent methyltransferase